MPVVTSSPDTSHKRRDFSSRVHILRRSCLVCRDSYIAMALRNSRSLRNCSLGHVRLLFGQDLLSRRCSSGLAEAQSTSVTSGSYFAAADGPRDHFYGTLGPASSAGCEDHGRLSAVSAFASGTAAQGVMSKHAGIMSLFSSPLCSRGSHVSMMSSHGIYAGGQSIRHMATYERT